jgi:hypothetical protein
MTPESVFTALQRLARRQGRAVQELVTLYVLEQFLVRLVESTHSGSFVVKGGVLLAGYGLRRPTRDIDMQAIDVSLNEKHCAELVEAVATANVDDDGVVFDATPKRIERIRDDEQYAGLRVHVRAKLHNSRIAISVDLSAGDPISPHAQLVTMPRILGGHVTVLGHPAETVIAEKAVTMLQRGATSTRWRDYMDIRSLSHSRSFSAATLRTAIEAVARHRVVELSAPSTSISGHDDLAQQKWAAWRRKSGVEANTVPTLTDHLIEICSFLDPVFVGELHPDAEWDPNNRAWELRR